MPRVRTIPHEGGPEIEGYRFSCPGCGFLHEFYVHPTSEYRWSFNGDVDRPTFSPSMAVQGTQGGEHWVCHSFVRDGEIQFLSDCTHALKGQTVPLAEIEGGEAEA